MSSRTALIVRHEFLNTIKRKGFIIITLAIPVLALLGIGGLKVASSIAAPPAVVTHIGYVDHIGGFDPLYDVATIQLVRMESEDVAADALVSGEVAEYFVIPADYVATGTLARYTLGKKLVLPTDVSSAIEGFLDSNLLASDVPAELIDRVLEPPRFVTTALTPEGTIDDDQGGFAKFIVPVLFGALLAISLILSTHNVLQSLGEEKESRLMEILLSTVSTRQLATGKLLGRGAAGLLQVLVWVVSLPLLLWLASATLGGMATGIQVPPGLLLLAVVYFILGYLLFAVVALAIAAISSSVREAQSIAPLFGLLAIVPLQCIYLLIAFPDSPIWVVLSFVPFSAPTLIMLRLGFASVPVWQVAASMIVLLASVLGGLWIASKLLRIYLLMYGKRPRFREIVRALRAG